MPYLLLRRPTALSTVPPYSALPSPTQAYDSVSTYGHLSYLLGLREALSTWPSVPRIRPTTPHGVLRIVRTRNLLHSHTAYYYGTYPAISLGPTVRNTTSTLPTTVPSPSTKAYCTPTAAGPTTVPDLLPVAHRVHDYEACCSRPTAYGRLYCIAYVSTQLTVSGQLHRHP